MFKFGTIDFGALRFDVRVKGGVLVNKFGHQELNIQSASLARDLFRKATQKRHAPLVAFLRSGLRREVMIIANGEAWRKTHDALAPFFTHGRVNETYAPIIDAVARATCSTIAAGSDGTIAIEIERVMRIALARVMSFVVFGRVLTEAEAERLEQDLETVTRKPDRGALSAINVAMAFVLRRIGLARNQKILFSNTRNRAISSLLDWIGEVIDQQKAGGGESPLIDALEQRYASCDPRDRKVRVVAECAMLFIAGIETTAAALTFTFAELCQDADLSRQAAEEARAFDPADMRDIAKACPHLNAVLQETLRRHTIVPTMLRDAAEAIELDAETEVKIGAARIIIARSPKIVARRGATLRYFPLQSHLRRQVWKNPLSFDPRRFACPFSAEQRDHYAPFGIGPQMCLGRNMAMIESLMLLVAILRRFDILPIRFETPIRVERNAVFTNRPVGVIVKLRAR
jgi:unspecific monooxygenase